MKPTRWLIALLTVAAATGCSTKTQVFRHNSHRSSWALQLEELRHVQFYISEQVLAHELGDSGTLAGPDHVFVVLPRTPGVVTDAGPDWLRVSFDRGPGVLFAARPQGSRDPLYLLATEEEPGGPIRSVAELPEKILRVGGRRFRIVQGASAVLLINAGDLTKLIGSRTQARGRQLE